MKASGFAQIFVFSLMRGFPPLSPKPPQRRHVLTWTNLRDEKRRLWEPAHWVPTRLAGFQPNISSFVQIMDVCSLQQQEGFYMAGELLCHVCRPETGCHDRVPSLGDEAEALPPLMRHCSVSERNHWDGEPEGSSGGSRSNDRWTSIRSHRFG